jgi:triacylglycerol lipase
MLGREAFAWVRQGQLMYLSRARPRVDPENGRVVVFVHGYGAAGEVFEPMRAHVEEKLRVATSHFTYKSMWSFAKVTNGLASRVDALAARGNQIDIVGHSLGGLLSRWYVQEMGGHAHVSRLITLATPHAGTGSAAIAVGPMRHVLMPGGAIIKRLAAGRDRASNVAHTAFVAGRDLMVTPPASAAALERAEVRWFEDLGHNALLYDDAVFDAVTSALHR